MQHLLIELGRLGVWLVLLAAFLVPLERAFALHAVEHSRAGKWQDIGLYFLNSLLPVMIISVPAAALVVIGRALLPHYLLETVSSQPLWLRLLAAFFIGELGFYWGHRWSHEVPLLWSFHAVHHRPEHMDWLVNTRSHPIDMVFVRLCGLAPLYLLGLAQAADAAGNAPAALIVVIGTFWGFLLHANIRWRLGWMEKLIASPFFHHWHHNRAGVINRNYAAMLPVLDRVFRTYHNPESWPEGYGISEDTATRPDLSNASSSTVPNGSDGLRQIKSNCR